MRENGGSDRDVSVYGTGGSYSEDSQFPVHGLGLPGLEIHIRKGVKLSHDNVTIVGADAG